MLKIGRRLDRFHGEQVTQLHKLLRSALIADLLQRLDYLEQVMKRLLELAAGNVLQVDLLVHLVQERLLFSRG